MHNFEIIENKILDEITYKTTLKNGLDVYICKKKGYQKKVGMFGTKYGSIINDFVDINSGKRIKVPDGVAHFLEHKLFEQEGANALDLFSKIGVSSNAYTSFDHTVYYFETIDKFNEAIELLIKLVKTPYFTKENVDKEQGIIAQEISMYDDDPSYIAYFNTLKAMYINHPISIDIAGTVESISHITEDILYTCYNTFYNPSNMFFVVVGDVDENETVELIEKNIKLYEPDFDSKTVKEVEKYISPEPEDVKTHEIEQKLDIYMPQLGIGYKLLPINGDRLIKMEILADIVYEMYFSKITNFYQKEYNSGLLIEPVIVEFEGSSSFAHILLSAISPNIDTLKEHILDYIEMIKNSEIDLELFETIKKKKIGENILVSESITISYRRIIESIVDDTTLYAHNDILKNITPQDVKEFLNNFESDKQVISVIRQK